MNILNISSFSSFSIKKQPWIGIFLVPPMVPHTICLHAVLLTPASVQCFGGNQSPLPSPRWSINRWRSGGGCGEAGERGPNCAACAWLFFSPWQRWSTKPRCWESKRSGDKKDNHRHLLVFKDKLKYFLCEYRTRCCWFPFSTPLICIFPCCCPIISKDIRGYACLRPPRLLILSLHWSALRGKQGF